jgi:hypothetical protein
MLILYIFVIKFNLIFLNQTIILIIYQGVLTLKYLDIRIIYVEYAQL